MSNPVEVPVAPAPEPEGRLGPIGRARASLTAIEVLLRLREDQTAPTEEDLAALRNWPGWGPLAPALSDTREGTWAEIGEQLQRLLTPREYRQAEQGTPTAYYTPDRIAEAAWSALRDLGFNGGRILEPGCGAGTFINHTPDGLDVRWFGVERDPTTAGIAALLHPDAEIVNARLQDAALQSNSVDAVLGNVPYGNFPVHDKTAPKAVTDSIHNYFIWRSVQAMRPGGVAILLTSRYTMDSQGEDARRAIAQHADLLGAIRLPNGALAEGGTGVLADILIVRRRDGEGPIDESWMGTSGVPGVPDQECNDYFLAHPEHVLGEWAEGRAPRYGHVLAVKAPEDQDLGAALGEAFASITTAARTAGREWNVAAAAQPWTLENLPFPVREDGRKEGSFHLVDDKPHEVVDGELVAVARAGKELPKLIRLRDATLALIEAETNHDTPDEQLEPLRAEVNRLYDAYVRAHGPINRYTLAQGEVDEETGERAVSRRYPRLGGFRRDPDFVAVLALEDFDDETQTADKAPLLLRRVNKRIERPTSASSPEEALSLCLNFRNKVDVGVIAQLLSIEEDQVADALGELVFADPDTGELLTAGEYLSGPVVDKLERAEFLLGQGRDELQRHVDALREVQPEPLPPEDIKAKLGAPWIPVEDVKAFAEELLGTEVEIIHVAKTATWNVDTPMTIPEAATSEWGTSRVNAFELLDLALNGQSPKVYDTFRTPEGGSKRVRNDKETLLAETKLTDLGRRFASWVWEDPDRADRLAADYNRIFNSTVLRKHDGSHLTVDGIDPNFKPYEHQWDFVQRVLTAEEGSLCPYPVGAGKTATMFMTALKLKQLGLVNKPMIVVPNHLLEQISRDGKKLFQGANILMAGKKDLADARSRMLFAARCATGDWDAIVMTHNSFGRLGVHPVTEATYLEELANAYREALSAVDGDDANQRRIKEIAKMVDRFDARASDLRSKATDAGVTFENLGIDFLQVDEAHLFKNLALPATTEGMALGKPSKRATDLDLKIITTRERTGRDNVVALYSGTFLSNSVRELFVFKHYTMPKRLEKLGLASPDAWAANFIRFESRPEVGVDGVSFRLKRRPVEYTNADEAISLFTEVAELRPRDAFKIKRPKRVDRFVEIEATPNLVNYVGGISDRIDRIQGGKVKPWEDNMLNVITDGRKAALDLELVGVPPDGPGKAGAIAENVLAVYHRTKDLKLPGDPEDVAGGFQVVFCDLGTPSKQKGSQVYGKVRRQLIDGGIPRERIRFIHDYNSDLAKEQLFTDCRAGKVSVLFASTEKAGVGTNVQTRGVALHHADPPHKPAEWEQREGRLDRPGNGLIDLGMEVEFYRYLAKNSFDSFMFQQLERKQRIIVQIMSGQKVGRVVQEIDPVGAGFGQAKAIVAGNPLLLEMAEVNAQLGVLLNAADGHRQAQSRMKRKVEVLGAQILQAERSLSGMQTMADALAGASDDLWRTADGRLVDADDLPAALAQSAQGAKPQLDLSDGYRWRGIDVGFTFHRRQQFGGIAYEAYAHLVAGDHQVDVRLNLSWFGKGQTWRIAKALGEEADKAMTAPDELRRKLTTWQAQLEDTRSHIGRPFDRHAELEAVRERRAALEAAIAAGAADSGRENTSTGPQFEPGAAGAEMTEAEMAMHDAAVMAGTTGGTVIVRDEGQVVGVARRVDAPGAAPAAERQTAANADEQAEPAPEMVKIAAILRYYEPLFERHGLTGAAAAADYVTRPGYGYEADPDNPLHDLAARIAEAADRARGVFRTGPHPNERVIYEVGRARQEAGDLLGDISISLVNLMTDTGEGYGAVDLDAILAAPPGTVVDLPPLSSAAPAARPAAEAGTGAALASPAPADAPAPEPDSAPQPDSAPRPAAAAARRLTDPQLWEEGLRTLLDGAAGVERLEQAARANDSSNFAIVFADWAEDWLTDQYTDSTAGWPEWARRYFGGGEEAQQDRERLYAAASAALYDQLRATANTSAPAPAPAEPAPAPAEASTGDAARQALLQDLVNAFGDRVKVGHIGGPQAARTHQSAGWAIMAVLSEDQVKGLVSAVALDNQPVSTEPGAMPTDRVREWIAEQQQAPVSAFYASTSSDLPAAVRGDGDVRLSTRADGLTIEQGDVSTTILWEELPAWIDAAVAHEAANRPATAPAWRYGSLHHEIHFRRDENNEAIRIAMDALADALREMTPPTDELLAEARDRFAPPATPETATAPADDASAEESAPEEPEQQLPEGAKPVPGAEGYHYTEEGRAVRLYTEPGEQVGAAKWSYSKYRYEGDVRGDTVRGTEDGATVAQRMANHHAVVYGDRVHRPPLDDQGRDPVWILHNGSDTLVFGVRPEDETARAALWTGGGFKQSRKVGGWYLPRTWKEPTRKQRVDTAVRVLAAAGRTVTVHVDRQERQQPPQRPARLPELNVTAPNLEEVPQFFNAAPFAGQDDVHDVRRLEDAYERWSQHPTVVAYLNQDNDARPNGFGAPDNPIAELRGAYMGAMRALREPVPGGPDEIVRRIYGVAAWCQALEPAVDTDLLDPLQDVYAAAHLLAARSQATIEALAAQQSAAAEETPAPTPAEASVTEQPEPGAGEQPLESAPAPSETAPTGPAEESEGQGPAEPGPAPEQSDTPPASPADARDAESDEQLDLFNSDDENTPTPQETPPAPAPTPPTPKNNPAPDPSEATDAPAQDTTTQTDEEEEQLDLFGETAPAPAPAQRSSRPRGQRTPKPAAAPGTDTAPPQGQPDTLTAAPPATPEQTPQPAPAPAPDAAEETPERPEQDAGNQESTTDRGEMATPPSATDTDAIPVEDPPAPRSYTETFPLAADARYQLHLTGVDGQGPREGELRYGDTTIAAVRVSALGRWFARLTVDGTPTDVTALNDSPQDAAHQGAILFSALTGEPYGEPPTAAVAPDGRLKSRADMLRVELRSAAEQHLRTITVAAARVTEDYAQNPQFQALSAQLGKLGAADLDNHGSQQMAANLTAVQQAVNAWGGALPADPALDERQHLAFPLLHLLYDTTRLHGRLQATLEAAQAERAAAREQEATAAAPAPAEPARDDTAQQTPPPAPDPAPAVEPVRGPTVSLALRAGAEDQVLARVQTEDALRTLVLPGVTVADMPGQGLPAAVDVPMLVRPAQRAEYLVSDEETETWLAAHLSDGLLAPAWNPAGVRAALVVAVRDTLRDSMAPSVDDVATWLVDTAVEQDGLLRTAPAAADLDAFGAVFAQAADALIRDGSSEHLLWAYLGQQGERREQVLALATPRAYEQLLALPAPADAPGPERAADVASTDQPAPSPDLPEDPEMAAPTGPSTPENEQLAGAGEAERQREWERLDAEYHEDALAARAVDDEYERYTNPLHWLDHRDNPDTDLAGGEEESAAVTGDGDARTEAPAKSVDTVPEPSEELPLWNGPAGSDPVEDRPLDVVADFEAVQEAWDEHVPADKGTGADLFASVETELNRLESLLAEAIAKVKPDPEPQTAAAVQSAEPAAAPSPAEPEEAAKDRDPQQSADAVNMALREADAHAPALQELPEWQRIQGVRGAFSHLMTVIKERAGEHFDKLMGDGRVADFVRRVSIGVCEKVAGWAQAGADRLRRNDDRGTGLPSAEALLRLGDAAFEYRGPRRADGGGTPPPNPPANGAAGPVDIAALRRMGEALNRPMPGAKRGVSTAAARGRSTTTAKRGGKKAAPGGAEQAGHLRRGAAEQPQARKPNQR
ncbi:hypothetical protein M1P56_35790 (plasmid) [Streptomyces sp. HU2014]|uniref:hypothetical protein n=1 Tax=Streptomyces sp. HU2014 TaxID=2939414 RepID=UPI00200F2AC1|nr:hypothetical protein [Streptomyces sp. HU2014]UQI49853.1 hypothetical protein M1P56_35790 [Streptomyces sp. HU2014]